jgi:Helix-turn-helix domain
MQRPCGTSRPHCGRLAAGGQHGRVPRPRRRPRRSRSRFRSQVGLTPKRAAQLVRFDHAAHLLAAGHSAARVAAETGYADQSHLHRDVMAFAGVTPIAVAVAPWLAVDDVSWAAPEHGVAHGLSRGLPVRSMTTLP